MQDTEECWHRMFELHTKLIEDFDENSLLEFKQGLDTIPYVYAKPDEGLGIGSSFVSSIALWFDNASRWSADNGDFCDAEKYLERALDYYCDPTLDYDDDIIDETKERMRNLVENCLISIYQGCHDIENIN